MASHMATIATLPRGVSDYIAVFDLTAFAVTREGRFVVTRNPAGAASAWRCEAKEARRLTRHARKSGADIPAAARELGVLVTVHHVAMQRAGASVSRIDVALAEAQRSGAMKFFDAEHRANNGRERLAV